MNLRWRLAGAANKPPCGAVAKISDSVTRALNFRRFQNLSAFWRDDICGARKEIVRKPEDFVYSSVLHRMIINWKCDNRLYIFGFLYLYTK